MEKKIYVTFLISFVILYLINPGASFSYLYTLVILSISCIFIDSKYFISNFFIFHFYLLLSVCIYLVQLYNLHDYLGLSGPGNVGTDDTKYFAQLVDFTLPYLSTESENTYPFVYFLRVLYPFPIYNPLNIIIPNLLGITFLPYLTYKFSFELTKNDKISLFAKRLTLFCPFTISVGIILMRDIWVVSFLILCLYSYLKKRYSIMIIAAVCIAFIRFGSIVFVGVSFLILFRNFFFKKFKNIVQGQLVYLVLLLIFFLFFIVSMPLIIEISGGKFEGFFRESFLSILARLDGDAILVKLILLPRYLSIPLLTIFFLFAPFVSFTIYTQGVFNLRHFMATTLSPLLLCFCWQYIFRSFFLSFKHKGIRDIVFIVLSFAFLLGTISLQVRHKTIMMPFLYILTAYGFYSETSSINRLISRLLGLGIAIFQLYFLIR